ncbi:hypothetical protein CYMTET_27242, partial [Cymbomonas tetramitiformis]
MKASQYSYSEVNPEVSSAPNTPFTPEVSNVLSNPAATAGVSPALRTQLSKWSKVIDSAEKEIAKKSNEINWLKARLRTAEWEALSKAREAAVLTERLSDTATQLRSTEEVVERELKTKDAQIHQLREELLQAVQDTPVRPRAPTVVPVATAASPPEDSGLAETRRATAELREAAEAALRLQQQSAQAAEAQQLEAAAQRQEAQEAALRQRQETDAISDQQQSAWEDLRRAQEELLVLLIRTSRTVEPLPTFYCLGRLLLACLPRGLEIVLIGSELQAAVRSQANGYEMWGDQMKWPCLNTWRSETYIEGFWAAWPGGHCLRATTATCINA